MAEKNCKPCKKTTCGGQALIEGIMMKGPARTVIAVREPNRNICVEDLPEKHLKDNHKFFGLPLIRGAVNLIESMVAGYKALMFSAEKSGMTDLEEEEDRKKAAEKREKKADRLAAKTGRDRVEVLTELEEKDRIKAEKGDGVLMSLIMGIASVLGVCLALFLFMWLPMTLFNLLNGAVPADLSNWRGVFEGIVKIIIFICYVMLCAQMKDIKRVFQYHGAEHKTIFCYEAGEELTVENVKKQSRFHPRCGTSFMILMLLVSILFYSLLILVLPSAFTTAIQSVALYKIIWVVFKLLMLPIICGLGYELIRICGRHDNLLTRIIAAPGLWVQRITTSEPEDDMCEVAITALSAVIPENGTDDEWK